MRAEVRALVRSFRVARVCVRACVRACVRVRVNRNDDTDYSAMTDFMANFVADTGFVPQDTISHRDFVNWLKAFYDTGLASRPDLLDRETVRLRVEEKLHGIALRLAIQEYVGQDESVILENRHEEAGLWAAVRPASSHATVAASGVTQVVKRLLLFQPFRSTTAAATATTPAVSTATTAAAAQWQSCW